MRSKIYTGGYTSRQNEANADKATCFIAHHLNSCATPNAGYACVVVARNASKKTLLWAREYLKALKELYDWLPIYKQNGGVVIGGFGGRGEAQIQATRMPAILVEPLFASNPDHAAIIREPVGQLSLAVALVRSIERTFERPDLIALSPGHGTTKKGGVIDYGCAVHGATFDPALGRIPAEHDYVSLILKEADAIIQAGKSVL